MLNYLFIRKLCCWKRARIFFRSLVFCSFLASARFEEGHFVFVWDRALVIFSFFFFLRVCCYGGLFSENACPAKDETSVRRNPKHKSHLLTLFATICNVPWHAKQSSEMCLSLDWRRVSRNFRSVYIRWCKNVVVIFWCSLDTACNCTAVLMQGLVPRTDTCPTLALQRAADFSPLLCFYIQRRFVFCTLGTALPCFNLWFPLDFVCT